MTHSFRSFSTSSTIILDDNSHVTKTSKKRSGSLQINSENSTTPPTTLSLSSSTNQPDRAQGGTESPSGFFGIFGGKSRKSSSTAPNQPEQIKEEEIS
jgi:hypothetical protein